MSTRDIVTILLLCAFAPAPASTQTTCDIAWTPPVRVTENSVFSTLPEIHVSGDTVHLAWIGVDSVGLPIVRYARSTDAGASFSIPAAPLFPYAAQSVRLAGDNGKVFILAGAFLDAFTGIVIVSSTDGGATWSDPSPVCTGTFLELLFASDEGLFVGFREVASSYFGILRSTDGGASWDTLGRRMRDLSDVAVSGARFHGVGPTPGASQIETGYYLSVDTGSTWSGPSIISPEDLVRSTPSRISMSARGDLYSAWIDSGAVIFRYSRNSGISWGEWNALSRGPGCFPVDLASDRAFVLAVWGTEVGGVRGIRARMSNDYGAAFCPETVPGGGDAAREPVLTIRDSIAHLAWIDDTGGSLEVFYRKGVLPKSSDGGETPPEAFALRQSYPNPTNGFAYIGFDVPAEAEAGIGIYNVLGELVARLEAQTYAPGRYVRSVDVGALPSGAYFYRFTAPGFDRFGKMVVLR